MTESQPVLVTGATGTVGRHLVAGLLQAGATVRALVRRPEFAGLPPEVELVAGDLTDPATVAAAAEGVDRAFLLWPSFSPDGAAPVVEALAEHVARIVYLSAANVQDERPEDSGVWGAVEQLVEKSGVEWTFLRAGGFAANTLGWAEAIRTGDAVRMPFPAAGRSLIHERDIAAVAVRALLDTAHVGQKYVLTGPETLTQAEQVRIIGEVAGQPVKIEEQSAAQARQQMLDQGADPAFVDSSTQYWASLVDHPESVTDTVAEVTGEPAHTFRQWAEDHVDQFRMLPTAEVAERYVDAFRNGPMHRAMGLLAPDMVRTAPLETDGEIAPVRGLDAIMDNSQLTTDHEILSVGVLGPLLHEDRFAVRFTFEIRVSTGETTTTTKMSLYTVTNGRITHEEVFYYTHP